MFKQIIKLIIKLILIPIFNDFIVEFIKTITMNIWDYIYMSYKHKEREQNALFLCVYLNNGLYDNFSLL